VQGATVETILKEALKLDVDMIVAGSHGRGAMYQLLVGSVSEGVLHKSKCPVIVVPTHERS
jgi:nucleotide-binding universal stress UspA family protein